MDSISNNELAELLGMPAPGMSSAETEMREVFASEDAPKRMTAGTYASFATAVLTPLAIRHAGEALEVAVRAGYAVKDFDGRYSLLPPKPAKCDEEARGAEIRNRIRQLVALVATRAERPRKDGVEKRHRTSDAEIQAAAAAALKAIEAGKRKPVDICDAAGIPRKIWLSVIGKLKRDNLVLQHGTKGFAEYSLAPTP